MASLGSARFSSILEICEHEGQALERLEDPRLDDVLNSMAMLQAEIVATLAPLGSDN